MADELTIAKLMERMPKAFLPEKAAGVEATIQFHFTGAEAGDWTTHIAGGKCTVEKGQIDNPTLAVTVDSADWIAVISGKLNAMSAFAEQKLKLKGDLGLAMKMMNYFKLQ
jgi:putative sterol carrier protein